MDSGEIAQNPSGQASGVARMLTVRYLLVLGGLAACVIAGQLLLNQTIETLVGDAAEINMAGRQRMLSQRIALKLHEMGEFTPGPGRVRVLQELNGNIDMMESTNTALVEGNAAQNLPGIRTEAIRSLFFGPRGHIDENLKAVVSGTRDFLRTYAGKEQPSDAAATEIHRQAIGTALNDLLPALDGAVVQYQMESEARQALARTVSQINTAVLLILLGASALWVFRPMTRHINTAITDLLKTRQWLQETKNKAEEANKAKSAFLANMSHELRTPLNSIIGYSEVLLEDAEGKGDATYVPHLKKILYAGQHLSSLINDILDISKIEAGKMELTIENIHLPSLIEELAAAVSPLTAKGGNEWIVEVPQIAFPVRNDAIKLRQILMNLIGNAAKFTERGTIKLAVVTEIRDGQNWLNLIVSDTGIGIASDKIESLFEEFTQADTSTSRKYQGTGLGLAICKRVVELMGGKITAQSTLGEGATFRVNIPAVIGELPLLQPLVESAAASPAVEAHLTVLVVDDDPNARELIVRHLTREGFQVVTAAHGEEALGRARTLRPDIITLDVLMNGITGWDVLRKLQDDPATCAIPVIMCTIVDERNKGLSLGAVDYLSKPINGQQLVRTVKRNALAPSNGRVLVVEDDAPTRSLIVKHICDLGFAPIEVGNGMEAFSKLRGEVAPGLVILDLMMPEMDGFQFLRKFRDIPAYQHIPVIVVTAKDLSAAERRELRNMSSEIILKSQSGLKETLATLTSQIITLRASLPNGGNNDG